jgi:hypothetical protein
LGFNRFLFLWFSSGWVSCEDFKVVNDIDAFTSITPTKTTKRKKITPDPPGSPDVIVTTVVFTAKYHCSQQHLSTLCSAAPGSGRVWFGCGVTKLGAVWWLFFKPGVLLAACLQFA